MTKPMSKPCGKSTKNPASPNCANISSKNITLLLQEAQSHSQAILENEATIISDKLAEELSSKYNVTYKRVDFDLILSGINYYGPYLSSISYNAPETYIGELENIKSFSTLSLNSLSALLNVSIKNNAFELDSLKTNCISVTLLSPVLNFNFTALNTFAIPLFSIV